MALISSTRHCGRCAHIHIAYNLRALYCFCRLFVVRCSKCHVLFNGSDLVMKAAKNMYHIDCFRCVACSRQLMPGDNFALRDNGLFCLEDNEILDRNSLNTDSLTHQHNRINNNNKGEKRNSNGKSG